jgi:hypothetical protein
MNGGLSGGGEKDEWGRKGKGKNTRAERMEAYYICTCENSIMKPTKH